MSEATRGEGGGNLMGTWKAEYEYGQHMVHDEDGRLVMATRNRRVALLVAAAPKLLAACEAIARCDDLADIDVYEVAMPLAVEAVRDAIREARGEAE